MKIAIIGADGQVGSDLQKVIERKEIIPLTISDIDISNEKSVNSMFKKHSPNVVINTAAFHKVDDCEKQDQQAFLINGLGPKYLAIACKKNNASLVHISTDYIFAGDSKKPYTEDDVPDPRSAYGISKLAGEFYVRYLMEKYFIIRTSSLFGVAGCLGKGGGNFIETMIRLAKEKGAAKVVNDQIVSPTYTFDLAKKIGELIKTDKYGTYHITNNGQCSWFDFAAKIFEFAGLKVELTSVTSEQFKAPAHRPEYSVLKNQNLQKQGMDDLRSWDEALKDYLKIKGYLKKG